MIPQTGSMWKHYKSDPDGPGGLYVVDCVCLLETDSKTLMVVYRPAGPLARENMVFLRDNHARAFVRPLQEWGELVPGPDGKKVPRYRPYKG